jgi:predicted phage terminase large subunit-like protein
MLTKRVVLPTPHPEQIKELMSSARYKVSVHGRRWGKSVMGMIAVLAGHGPIPETWKGAITGGNIWWVAPTYGIAAVIWRMLREASKDAWVEKNETHKRLEFPGGGSVSIKSGDDPDSLRGDGLDGLVIDEAAFHSEEAIKSVLPSLSDKQGWCWFISTPNSKTNKEKDWFYRLFVDAQRKAGWQAWKGPTTTATVPQVELDYAREVLGEWGYRREYLAEFDDPGGNFFRREWFKYYENGGDTYRLNGNSFKASDLWKFATVDLAASLKESADYTVISTFAVTPANQLLLLDCDRVRMEGPDQVPLIEASWRKWHQSFIAIESVGYQLTLIQAARRTGLPIHEIKRDSRDKVARASFLQARMESGAVWFPQSASFLGEVEAELLAFPDAPHDDIVDTLSDGAAQLLQLKMPRIRSL